MFKLTKKISRTLSTQRQNKLFQFLIGIFILGLLLAGCNLFASPQPVVVAQPPTLVAEYPHTPGHIST